MGAVAGQAKKSARSDTTTHNRYIVMFREQPPGIAKSHAALQAMRKTNTVFSSAGIAGDSLIHQYKWASSGFAAHLTKTQVKKLRRHPLVKQVTRDVAFKALDALPALPAINSISIPDQITPWGISRVGGSHDGTGKRAWIIDSGIDLYHPDLNVDEELSKSFVPEGQPEGPDLILDSAQDFNGHGTFVAGLVGAKDNNRGVVGVAAGASMVAIKVCEGGYCYTSNLLAGIDYTANNFSPGDVANISLGYPTDRSIAQIDTALAFVEASITNAANAGLKFSISAGNEGINAGNKSPSRLEHPNIYTVSAFRQGDEFIQSFSCSPSFGSNFGNPPIEYSAPGSNVISLAIGGQPPYAGCGTSFSAPHIAGLLLVLGDNPIITAGFVSNDPDGNPDPIPSGRLNKVTLSGSIVNDRVYLDWAPVPEADSYIVQMRDNYDQYPAFTFMAEVTDTEYLGPSLLHDFNENLVESTQDYRVIARNNQVYNNAFPSNYVTFTYYTLPLYPIGASQQNDSTATGGTKPVLKLQKNRY